MKHSACSGHIKTSQSATHHEAYRDHRCVAFAKMVEKVAPVHVLVLQDKRNMKSVFSFIAKTKFLQSNSTCMRAATDQGPAESVLDPARVVVLRLHLPQLLEADPVALRRALLAQAEALVQLLRKVTVTTLREDGALGMQLHPALERVLCNGFTNSTSNFVSGFEHR